MVLAFFEKDLKVPKMKGFMVFWKSKALEELIFDVFEDRGSILLFK